MIDLPSPAPWRATMVALLLAAAFGVAACGAGDGASPPGSTAASPAPTAGATDAPDTIPTATPSADPAAGGALDPTTATACLELGAVACAQAREMAATTLTDADPVPRYIQVGPFGCAVGDRCATTLTARPEGDVTIEFDGGEGIAVHLTVAPDGTFATARDAAQGIAVPPASAPGLAAGPTPFTLGHCGIFGGIDVDGSWWDPVGPVAMDSGEAVNATPGILTAVDPNHATFTTPTGFAVQLQRRAGPKLLPFCM